MSSPALQPPADAPLASRAGAGHPALQTEPDQRFPWLYTAVDLFTQCVMFMVLVVTFGTEILVTRRPPVAEGVQKAVSAFERERQRLERLIAEQRLQGSVSLHQHEKGRLDLVLADAFFFASGQAELQPRAADLLQRIGQALADSAARVRVEGYTDDVPIHSRRYPSNWELSGARAMAVLRALLAAGVPAERLSAAGYGEYNPRFPNNSDRNRQANRRVEISLVFAP